MTARGVIAAGLVAVAFVGIPDRPQQPASGTVVIGGRTFSMSAADASLIRDIYSTAATIVEDDGKSQPHVIPDTDTLRRYHVAVLRFLWNGAAGNSLDKYAGLREAIESVLIATVGDDQKTLTDDMRKEVVAKFRSIGG